MGLLEQEIKELRGMVRDHCKGKLKPEDIHARIAIYSQIEKRAKMMLQAHAIAAKHGKGVLSKICDTNLIGSGAAIDMDGDDENEVVKCPARETFLQRHECLDISGQASAPDECDVCEHKRSTHHKLLPKPE